MGAKRHIHAEESLNSGTKRRHKGALPLVGESELRTAKMYGILHQKSAVANFFDFHRQKSPHITPKTRPFY
jgi:hypothetical protein